MRGMARQQKCELGCQAPQTAICLPGAAEGLQWRWEAGQQQRRTMGTGAADEQQQAEGDEGVSHGVQQPAPDDPRQVIGGRIGMMMMGASAGGLWGARQNSPGSGPPGLTGMRAAWVL